MNAFDREIMQRAVSLARKGNNTTTPNPRVGCVIVNNGTIIGEGYHRIAGQPHAEINALASVSDPDTIRGATVYVTLEPCSHTGRTAPCANALVEAGIGRLVYAMEDPNPDVSGAGLMRLRDAGIEVDGPLLEDEARALNPGFIKRMTEGLPYIRCKMAISLDGRTAMASGESKWITGPTARQDVQRIRAKSCAIITGVDSVLLDDPHLTVRLPECERQPLRVIVDSQLRCPATAEIFRQPGTTVVATCSYQSLPDILCWQLPEKEGRVDVRALAGKLAGMGCNEILLETGAKLAGAFVGAGLVDEFVIYIAAKLMGSSARPLFDIPIRTMSGALDLRITDVRAVGPDWRITAVPDRES